MFAVNPASSHRSTFRTKAMLSAPLTGAGLLLSVASSPAPAEPVETCVALEGGTPRIVESISDCARSEQFISWPDRAGIHARIAALTAAVENLTATGNSLTLENADQTNLINGLLATSDALHEDRACISRQSDTDNLYFEGCNVHVRNGTGATDTVNTFGNLIIGYDEDNPTPPDICSDGSFENKVDCEEMSHEWGRNLKLGSHNVVVGPGHSYTRHGGLVAGARNVINGDSASVSGGRDNIASGKAASVGGGHDNVASGEAASVGAGRENAASGPASSVSAGWDNTASGEASSVSGGWTNTASGPMSTVSGGQENAAVAQSTSVSGGTINVASGLWSSVSGGAINTASGETSSIGGGEENTASGTSSSVAGGWKGKAAGEVSAVTGGLENEADGHGSSVSGGVSNNATGYSSSVSGGDTNDATGSYSSVHGGRLNAATGDTSTVSGGELRSALGWYDWRAGELLESQ